MLSTEVPVAFFDSSCFGFSSFTELNTHQLRFYLHIQNFGQIQRGYSLPKVLSQMDCAFAALSLSLVYLDQHDIEKNVKNLLGKQLLPNGVEVFMSCNSTLTYASMSGQVILKDVISFLLLFSFLKLQCLPGHHLLILMQLGVPLGMIPIHQMFSLSSQKTHTNPTNELFRFLVAGNQFSNNRVCGNSINWFFIFTVLFMGLAGNFNNQNISLFSSVGKIGAVACIPSIVYLKTRLPSIAFTSQVPVVTFQFSCDKKKSLQIVSDVSGKDKMPLVEGHCSKQFCGH